LIIFRNQSKNLLKHKQEPSAVTTGRPPKLTDFILTGKDVELERAYKIRFHLTHPDGREIPRYWVGYYDASQRKSVPSIGYKRRKITPCADAEEDDE